MFTEGDYATAQTVTVHAKEDAVAQGPHSGHVTLVASSTDTTYSGMSLGVTVNITDSDSANLIVSKPTPDPVAEGGDVTFTVKLKSQADRRMCSSN